MKPKHYMNEIKKRTHGNKMTCDQCKKTQCTLHHVTVDHKDKTVTVLCNECFKKTPEGQKIYNDSSINMKS